MTERPDLPADWRLGDLITTDHGLLRRAGGAWWSSPSHPHWRRVTDGTTIPDAEITPDRMLSVDRLAPRPETASV